MSDILVTKQALEMPSWMSSALSYLEKVLIHITIEEEGMHTFWKIQLTDTTTTQILKHRLTYCLTMLSQK